MCQCTDASCNDTGGHHKCISTRIVTPSDPAEMNMKQICEVSSTVRQQCPKSCGLCQPGPCPSGLVPTAAGGCVPAPDGTARDDGDSMTRCAAGTWSCTARAAGILEAMNMPDSEETAAEIKQKDGLVFDFGNGACPDLSGSLNGGSPGSHTQQQWLDTIDANLNAGRQFYIGLPQTWWYGKTAAETKQILQTCHPAAGQ